MNVWFFNELSTAPWGLNAAVTCIPAHLRFCSLGISLRCKMTVPPWYAHLGIVFRADILVLVTIKYFKLSSDIGVCSLSSSRTRVTGKLYSHMTVYISYLGSQLAMEIKRSTFNIRSLFLQGLLVPFLDSDVTQNSIQRLYWSCITLAMPVPFTGYSSLPSVPSLCWANVKLSVTDFIPKNRTCSHDSHTCRSFENIRLSARNKDLKRCTSSHLLHTR